MSGMWLNKIINGCSNVHRWEGRQKLIRRNNAEHSFGVAVTAEYLCRVETDIFNNKVDVLKVLKTCLFHDGAEVCTGDILSTVKRETPSMRKAVEEVEQRLVSAQLEPYILENWRPEYRQMLLDPKEDKKTIEGRIIAVADNIDALNECIQEVRLGNNTFLPYLEVMVNSILDIDLESGRFFIKEELESFGGLPLDMYGSRVAKFIKEGIV